MTSAPDMSFPVGIGLGHEYAGEIVEIGKDVEGFVPGDRVAVLPMRGCGKCAYCLRGEYPRCDNWNMMMGGFAEYATADAHNLVKLPADLSMVDGALVEPLAGSLNAASLAGITRGARVLIMGAGSMGLGATFWSKRLGAGKVVVTARSNKAEAIALNMGANMFLAGVAPADLPAEAAEALGGTPDIVFECIGAPGMIATAVETVDRRGTVLVVGMCTKQDPWIPAVAMFKQVRIQFSSAYVMKDFHHAVDTMAAGAIEPRTMLTQTIGLGELPDVFEGLRHPNHQCKVMVDPWAS
jgi:(R,R)-butanediol dehydrogenase/meso-butanediol dehydrogenase/diacetyl reductase